MIEKKLLYITVLTVFALSFVSIPISEAHILVIGDSNSDIPQAYSDAKSVANLLKSKGYQVLELYRKNATSKNILKGMYGADAIIYAGHGGYESGHYNLKGGVATPPFALVGSNDFIWGVGNKMREGFGGKLFSAPVKKNIPVILLQACFSTGWVDDKEVANPVSTIYNFARMFTGSGANYYATAWTGAEIVRDLVNGVGNFADANNKNYEKITKMNIYKGTKVWKNQHGYAAFVGNWFGQFPKASQTTKYNNSAAEAWYNSDRSKNPFQPDLTVTSIRAPSKAFKGSKITIPNTLSNLANVGSSSFFVSYYLKKDFKSPSIYLDKRFYTTINAKSNLNLYTKIRIPTTIASGSYYLMAYVDSGQNNAETNENNNFHVSSTKVNVVTPYRDLVVNGITAKMKSLNGNTFQISSTVKNTGTLSTSHFAVNYYLKKKGTTGRGTIIGQNYYTGLAAGASKHQDITIKQSKSVMSSHYLVAAYVDAHKTVHESNENNNYTAGTIKA